MLESYFSEDADDPSIEPGASADSFVFTGPQGGGIGGVMLS